MANLSNINNKLIVTDGGDVMINNTIAGYPNGEGLTVKSSNNICRVVLQNSVSGGSVNDGFRIGLVNSNVEFESTESGEFQFYTGGGAAKMTIDSSGRVGIGMTSPAYKLNVEDSASFLFYGATDATTGSVFRLRSNNKAVTIVDIDAAGNATFANRVSTGESFNSVKDGADTVADGPFFALKNAAGTRQYINQLDASNNIDYWYYNGSTWTQTISLLNDGGATFADGVRVDGGDLILGDEALSSSAAYVGMKTAFQSGSSDYMIISGTSDGNTYVSSKSGGATHIRGGGNTSAHELVITSSAATFTGNVKIGATSPTGTPSTNANDLVIDKGASESGITLMSTAAASIRFGDAANTSIGSIEYNHNSNYMRMIVNNEERARITSDGDVFIGNSSVTTANTAIFLNKSGIITNVLANSGGTTDLMQFYQQNGGGIGTISRNADGICMNGNGQTNQLVAADSGNVGIGVTPGTYLSSIRALRIGQGASFSAFTNSLNTYVSSNVRVDASGNNKAIVTGESAQYRQSDGTHIWYNAASVSAGATSTLTERMRIDSSGNVGIGTDSPNPFGWGNKHLTLTTTGINQYVALDIIGTGNAAGAILFGGGDGSGSGTNIGRAQISALDGSNLVFATNGSNSGASFNERMRISSGGLITMNNLGGYSFANSDVRYSTITKELYYQTSSKRYKTDIVNLENSLDKINSLRPVRYKDINTETLACGLIAEEVVETIPEVVFKKEIEGFDEPQIEGLNYSDLVPFLIKSIQELKADNDTLKSRIETLENK